MATKYSKDEIEAIEKKMNNPTGTVICPRCGKELLFNDYATASEVKCTTNDCLHGIVRGI